MLVTPILIPLVMSLIITRLSLASRSSRERIKLLEKEESGTERLAHIIGRLEREVEDAVIDMFDGDAAEAGAASQAAHADKMGSEPSTAVVSAKQAKKAGAEDVQPVLRDVQKKMVKWLNSLPGLKKELVYIHPVRNSHAVIISRDVKRFPSHRQGEGVIRHWADHFII